MSDDDSADEEARVSSSALSPPLELPERKVRRDWAGLTVSLSKRFPQHAHPQPVALRAAQVIESRPVQAVFMALLLLDVALVLAELILETEVLRVRLQICATNNNATTAANSTAAPAHAAARWADQHVRSAVTFMFAFFSRSEAAGGDPGQTALLHNLELAESILRYISLGILGIFALELLALLLIFRQYFFLHIFYVIDTVIVGLSIGLEVGLRGQFTQEVVSVIIFLRLWRLVRAGHGLLVIEGEKVAELHLRARKNVVRYAKLQADVRQYEVQMLCLEQLLDFAGIVHPSFSSVSKKFHRVEPEHFDSGDSLNDTERAMLSEWLEQAEQLNSQFAHHHLHQTMANLRQSLKKRDTVVLPAASGPAPTGPAATMEYEDFLLWKKTH